MAIDKKAIREFTERWKGIGYEKGDTQKYWLQLLQALGYTRSEDVRFEYHLPGGGYIDVWLRDAGVLIEQKGLEIDLDKPEPRQGKMKTPLDQAVDYVADLPMPEQPRFIITCNFRQFRVYDRERYGRSELSKNVFEFTLEELAERPDYLNIIVDPNNSRLEKEKQVSIEAGRLIGRLYDLMREGYIDPDSEGSQHALNVLCVRLVFCLYCEDSDLFEKDAFYNYLKDVPAQNIRMNLKRLFKALDTPVKDRDPYDTAVKGFPYVNGGLFREETEIPNFSEEAKDFLLNQVSAPVNWSRISPTIFGGIFESTLNPETRRKGGMHYTSPENIHKVIDPLFLDDLKKEFTDIRDDDELTPRQKKNRYRAFHRKICSLKFLDPAAGSGNFLTETYLCLRKLEDRVLMELLGGQASLGLEEDEDKGTRISLNQFYGIEINDFAVTVAETALWISRLKANGEESMLLSLDNDFPLSERANIVHANALRKDWNDVLPASECSYIMGNPPFYGATMCSAEQKQEIVNLFGKIRLSNSLDYVSGWYYKACEMMNINSKIHAAFVSTNSITQGEQVYPIWNTLIIKFNIKIDFAWRTFVWNSEAASKAHVHCVIIGISKQGVSNRIIYSENGTPSLASNINPYLIDAPNCVVNSRATPLFKIPKMLLGNKPADDGNLILSTEEKNSLIAQEPDIVKFIHRYIGAVEFINNKERWCLWFPDDDINELYSIPLVAERLKRVMLFRKASSAAPTRKTANIPNKFFFISQPDTTYLLFPSTSSCRRNYVPIGFMSPEVIASNSTSIVDGASLYEFGIASSQFHNAWLRVVGGRLKSDYRYTGSLVWNTFPWPDPAPEQKQKIEDLAQGVLDARDNHPGKSLADLYDPDKMPADLLAAHKALDKAVEEAYGADFDGDEERIVAHLFKLYSEKTTG